MFGKTHQLEHVRHGIGKETYKKNARQLMLGSTLFMKQYAALRKEITKYYY